MGCFIPHMLGIVWIVSEYLWSRCVRSLLHTDMWGHHCPLQREKLFCICASVLGTLILIYSCHLSREWPFLFLLNTRQLLCFKQLSEDTWLDRSCYWVVGCMMPSLTTGKTLEERTPACLMCQTPWAHLLSARRKRRLWHSSSPFSGLT